MQQLTVTYTLASPDDTPTVVMQSVGFEDDDLFTELQAAKEAYQQLKKRYAVRLEADGMDTSSIVDILAML